MKSINVKRLLVIFCLVAFVGILHSYGRSYPNTAKYYVPFFKAKNSLAYKTLLKFAYPTDKYLRGNCYVKPLKRGRDFILITVFSESRSTEGEQKTQFKLYVDEDRGKFTGIDVFSDSQRNAFGTVNLSISLVQEVLDWVFKYYNIDRYVDYLSLAWNIVMGKSIKEYDAKTICVSTLSFLWNNKEKILDVED